MFSQPPLEIDKNVDQFEAFRHIELYQAEIDAITKLLGVKIESRMCIQI